MATAAATAEWDAHPYYQLLPSYVTKQSVEAERRALFRRVEVRFSCCFPSEKVRPTDQPTKR